MIINDDFSYKRGFFVKDLLSPESFIKNASFVEFDTFSEFAKVCLKDKKFGFEQIDKIIVPAENAYEVALLLSIRPQVRPFLIIYLKDFSVETRDAFIMTDKCALMCDSNRIEELKKEMIEHKSDAFVSYIRSTYGYFKDVVTMDEVDNILYKYTTPFFEFPFFCVAMIRWDWESFNELPLKDLKKPLYQARLMRDNLPERGSSIDFSSYYTDDFKKYNQNIDYNRTFQIDRVKSPNAKYIYVKDGKLYIDCPESELYFDMYDENLVDGNLVDFNVINRIRLPFDVKLTDSTISDPSLLSVWQNIKCTGNPAMVPYLSKFISTILTGGIV